MKFQTRLVYGLTLVIPMWLSGCVIVGAGGPSLDVATHNGSIRIKSTSG